MAVKWQLLRPILNGEGHEARPILVRAICTGRAGVADGRGGVDIVQCDDHYGIGYPVNARPGCVRVLSAGPADGVPHLKARWRDTSEEEAEYLRRRLELGE